MRWSSVPPWPLVIVTILLLASATVLLAQNEKRLNQEKIISALHSHYGERAAKRGKAWFNLIATSHNLDEAQQLGRVNNFFNQLFFTEDTKLWGVDNYWATPLEFLGANAGDCEDFALAKYFTLLEVGIPDEKMRLTMVKAVALNQYHMVVAFYPTPSSVPLILDNLKIDIASASSRKDLIPVYSFNGKQLWLNKKKNQGVIAGDSQRLNLWKDLNQRMGINNLKQPKFLME